ncbi:hypothetical protein Tco_0717458, partial [Tanacetum coccineum]
MDSPFDLEAFSNSDYDGASLDRKSTIEGCQFLGKILISWQCKKQTIVANSNTEAEYVDAANCCGQVLWIQNQMLDYGINFMNTKIHIDNESTICIVKNPVFHSKTKHIEIRHHFIRDYYEKKLIQVIKIHTDYNVADLLTKAFDVSSGPIHLVADETVYKKWEDRMERAATISSSLKVEQDSGSGPRLNLMLPVQVNAVEEKPEESNGFEEIIDFLNESFIQYALTVNPTICTTYIEQFWTSAKLDDAEGTDCLPTATIFAELERMGYENLTLKLLSHPIRNFSSIPYCNALVLRLHLGMNLVALWHLLSYVLPQTKKLTFPSTSLQEKVLNLEKAKTAQAKEIASLKKRVKKLEKIRKLKTLGLKRLRKIEVTLVDETQEMNNDNLMFDTGVLEEQEKDVAKKEVSVADLVTTANVKVTTVYAPTTIDELTLAQTLIEIKAAKPKAITYVA